jgi:hypothetical protein
MGMFDWAEFWNPKVRAADCLNPQAASSILPIADLRTRMVMALCSKDPVPSPKTKKYLTGHSISALYRRRVLAESTTNPEIIHLA